MVHVGIDLTARNLQEEAKKAGLPWSASKGTSLLTCVIFGGTGVDG